MTRTQLDRHTLRFQRRWTGVAVGFAVVAAIVPAVAGGADPWFRWIAAVLTVGGVVAACRFRATLHLPLVSALSAAVLLPDDATIDPAIVAAICGVSMVLCVESVAVARRLVTAASVRSTAADARHIGLLGAAAVGSVTCVALLAQLEGAGRRWLIAGLPIAVAALIVAVAGSVPHRDETRR